MRWSRYDIGRYLKDASVYVHTFMNTANMLLINMNNSSHMVTVYTCTLSCLLRTGGETDSTNQSHQREDILTTLGIIIDECAPHHYYKLHWYSSLT